MQPATRKAEALSTTDAANRYQVTRNYVAQLARSGLIKALKFGRDWMVDEASLLNYLQHPQKRGPKPQTRSPRIAE